MQRSRFTIRSFINRYKGSENFESLERIGRPRKINDRECAVIIRNVNKDPKITSTQIAAELKEEFGNEAHPKTIRSH